MFRNKLRKSAFVIWAVAIPAALVGGLLKSLQIADPLSNLMIAGGIAASIFGLILLKAGGRAHV